MDRWSEDDIGVRAPAGKVARLGIGGFVKSNTGKEAQAELELLGKRGTPAY